MESVNILSWLRKLKMPKIKNYDCLHIKMKIFDDDRNFTRISVYENYFSKEKLLGRFYIPNSTLDKHHFPDENVIHARMKHDLKIDCDHYTLTGEVD